MQKTTFFMSKAEAEALTLRLASGQEQDLAGKTVLISINSPETSKEELKLLYGPDYATSHLAKMAEAGYRKPVVESPHWVELLMIEFNDIDPSHCSDGWIQQWTLFDDAMADKIIDILERTKDKASVYAVHCEAGVSRSAGVAKFISQYFNLSFPETYSLYNKHVFSVLLRRWRQRHYASPY
jgi:predicted protein tyrosine phosphatase